jgi:biotin synthase
VVSTLLSIKTGGCPEDCGYCPHKPQRYHTEIEGNDLMSVSQVKAQAYEQNQGIIPCMRERLEKCKRWP